ncbi:hypothetical protein RFI_24129, partial [Reticulomyxa filosa]
MATNFNMNDTQVIPRSILVDELGLSAETCGLIEILLERSQHEEEQVLFLSQELAANRDRLAAPLLRPQPYDSRLEDTIRNGGSFELEGLSEKLELRMADQIDFVKKFAQGVNLNQKHVLALFHYAQGIRNAEAASLKQRQDDSLVMRESDIRGSTSAERESSTEEKTAEKIVIRLFFNGRLERLKLCVKLLL